MDEVSAKLFLEEVTSELKSNLVFQKCDVSSYEEFKGNYILLWDNEISFCYNCDVLQKLNSLISII